VLIPYNKMFIVDVKPEKVIVNLPNGYLDDEKETKLPVIPTKVGTHT
jgi:hypothetical protein